jgi:hypothetical protein
LVLHHVTRARFDRFLSETLTPDRTLNLWGHSEHKLSRNRNSSCIGPFVPADDAGITDAVVCDTFLRFKGLERPAVIVTDLGGVANTKREVRMHIALTRALDLVRIVADEVAMGQDPVLSDLVGI